MTSATRLASAIAGQIAAINVIIKNPIRIIDRSPWPYRNVQADIRRS